VVQATPSATASLQAYASATPSLSATPWLATPKGTVALEPSPTPFVHVIKKGETMLGIAIQYGVELDQLLAANPDIDPHFLSVGQSLNIPGPNGEPVQSLLPTSTPVPLLVTTTRCFPTPSGQLICLATLTNSSGGAVEAVSGQITLINGAGEILDSHLTYAPLNLLPAGKDMPLYASFERPSDPTAGARTVINSAVEAQALDERYLGVDAGTPSVTFSGDRRRADVEGTLSVSASAGLGDWRESLLAIAYDKAGDIIGFAKWDSGEDPVHAEEQQFSLIVYSLGPAIDHVSFLPEARLVTPITSTPSP
jgi:LysM repeat protein